MFDWNSFVILGYLLLMEDGEEYVRSAISRQYYGLFGVLRRYLINVDYVVDLRSRKGDVHGKVFVKLPRLVEAVDFLELFWKSTILIDKVP